MTKDNQQGQGWRDRDRDRNQRRTERAGRGSRPGNREFTGGGKRPERFDQNQGGRRNFREERQNHDAWQGHDRRQDRDFKGRRGNKSGRSDWQRPGGREYSRDFSGRNERGERYERRGRGDGGERRSNSPDRRGKNQWDKKRDFKGRNRFNRDGFSKTERFAKQTAEKPHYGTYESEDPDEPIIPAGISAADLDSDAQKALMTLSGANQEIVARHLVMAGEVLDLDPELAYKHAQAAVKRAGRVDVVREAAALTAYMSGRFEEALREVRAVRRMRGDDGLRAIEADCERGLGRPERAIQIVEETDSAKFSLAEQVELALVSAGARADLGQTEMALLIVGDSLGNLPEEIDPQVRARLLSYQVDLLRELGREDEAEQVEASIPESEDPMEIIDLGAVRDADVDRVRSTLRGSSEPLAEMFDGALVDLDGVCYQGANAIEGAPAALKATRDQGMLVGFVTNNASRSPAEVAEKLRSLGFEAEPEEIMTSAMDLLAIVKEKVELGSKILVVGSASLKDYVSECGYQVVTEKQEEIAAVIQGFDPSIGWTELSEAAFALKAGARYYVTNLDRSLPVEKGEALGNGAFAAAVTAATGKRPEAGGKPNASIYLRAAAEAKMEKPLAVGDRLDTDVVGAIAAKIPAMHVLTGVHSARDTARAEAGARPSFVALDLSGLMEVHPTPLHHRDGTWTAGVSQVVQINHAGHAEIDGIEIVRSGKPVTISLDTYRALLAASWEFADNHPNRAVRLPVIDVVNNNDPQGTVTETNAEEDPAEETTFQETATQEAPATDAEMSGDVPESVAAAESPIASETIEAAGAVDRPVAQATASNGEAASKSVAESAEEPAEESPEQQVEETVAEPEVDDER